MTRPRPHHVDVGHSHDFDTRNPLAERRTRQVMWLTAIMMVVEIVAGTMFGSMALLADGWHMSSHAMALGVTAGAYALARRYADDPRFAFGTWKIEVLGGYTSAVFLLGVAAYMGVESVSRLLVPAEIHFSQAIPVALLGLAVNIVSAWMLSSGAHGHDDHHAPHDHHGHDHAHQHHDLNLRSAYLHVVADAATSVLAIIALLGGLYLGAGWLDPVMGLVGTVLVGRWALGLLRDTGRVLLDAEMDAPVVREVHEVIQSLPHSAEVRDLHVWRVGKGKYACIVSVTTGEPISVDEVRRQLAVHEELVHITVEVVTRTA
ncbi:MAG: CDF family Co(II)/Ni(II) efflux transporter DmeF [Steroidobacteraceae bacterium]|nr:CDF family Co(II)/Ni(II) efflux transporter DmeF [Steroidobacteraceae bacterium]